MNLETSLLLLRRLGVDVSSLSREDFSAAYYRLARRYHPDRNQATGELMANINAARTCILAHFRFQKAA